MSIREIRIISSTKTGVKTISSSAETWGQLKDSITDYGDLSKMTAVVKETRVTLADNEARLPEGSFTVYLSPKQIKAGGNGNSVEIITALRDKLNAAFNEILEEIEDGVYDDEEEEEKSSDLTASDKEFLASLKNM